MNLQTWSDERLLAERSEQFAGAAFEQFYLRHEGLIVAYYVRRVRDADLAAELTAETFAQALRSRKRFENRGPTSGVRWLYAIAFNVMAANARSANRQLRASQELRIRLAPLTATQASALLDAGSDDGVLAALEALPAQQREAVRAYVLDDLSYEEIAGQHGAAPSTVRKRVSRGLASMRRDLKETR